MVKKSRHCKSKMYRARHTRKRQRFGGGLKTAETYFYKNIQKQYPNIMNDAFFLRRIPGFVFPTMDEAQTYNDEHVKTKFKAILETIIGITDNKDLIDFVMQLYLTGKMGEPNSFENIGRLIDNATKFKVLKQKGKNDGKQLVLGHFPSLSELEEFINAKQEVLQQIEEEKTKQSKKADVQRRLREEGEDDVVVKFDDQNYIVYMPTTEAGSKFYGRNTRWCTAAEKHNMFADYTDGNNNLYIIQSRSNPIDKTQFHPRTMQFMNPQDIQVSAEEIERLFQDQSLKKWFREIMFDNFSRLDDMSFTGNDPLFFLKYRQMNKYAPGFNIDLFNNLFSLREMPQEMVENIKKRLLSNVDFLDIARLLSNVELDYIFEDESFKEKFMNLESVSKNTPWFFWSKFRKYYTGYFDNEKNMLQILTTPRRPLEHFEIISDRLKHDFNFIKELVSAEYGPHDDATKYCRQALHNLSNEKEIDELKTLCDEIENEQIKTGKSNRFHPADSSGELFI